MRKGKTIDSLISASVECELTGTDLSIEENRRAFAVRVIGALDKLKKLHKDDEEGHAVTTAAFGGTPLYHGKIDSSFRRTSTADSDDKLYFWDRLKKHHKFGEAKTDPASLLALQGGDKWIG